MGSKRKRKSGPAQAKDNTLEEEDSSLDGGRNTPSPRQPSTKRKKQTAVDVDAFLQGIVAAGTAPELHGEPLATESPMEEDVQQGSAKQDEPMTSVQAAAQAEELLHRLRAPPAEVSRAEKIDAAWQLYALARSASVSGSSAVADVTTLASLLPLLLEWLQPQLARSERYVMAGSDTEQSETDIEPQFLDVKHWHLFHELLANTPARTILLRMEMLRVISSALSICFGSVRVRELKLGIESRLQIVKHLEGIVTLLSSTHFPYFTPTLDQYVLYLGRVASALSYSFMVHDSQSTHDSLYEQMEDLCSSIVSTALKRFVDLRKTMEGNQKKLFNIIVGKLLDPLLSLRTLLLSRIGMSSNNHVLLSIKRSIEDIVLHTLFHQDHLFEYSLAFSLKQLTLSEPDNDEVEREGKRKGKHAGGSYIGKIRNYRKQLFDTLRERTSKPNDEEGATPSAKFLMVQNIPFLYRGFLDSLKALLLVLDKAHEKQLERREQELPTDNNEEDSKRPRQYIDFHFLLELHDTLKPMLILETNISESAEKVVIGVQVICELLKLVEEYRVYEPTQDTPEKAHLEFLTQLAIYLSTTLRQVFIYVQGQPLSFNDTQRKLVGVIYEGLKNLSVLSHLTLTELIPELWSILWDLPWPSAADVPQQCIEFSCMQLSIYTKLRQIDILLQQLLPSFIVHRGGHAHYVISSRPFVKQYYDCILQLPVGKIGATWEIFMFEINNNYLPQLRQYTSSKERTNQRDLIKSLSYVAHLFVGLIDSVLLANNTAPTVLGLVSKTCFEIVSPLLSLAMQDVGLPDKKGKQTADRATISLIVTVTNMYNALIGLREQCHHFPSTHAGKNSNKNQISDDVKTNKSFFYLLPDKKLHQVNFSEISWLYKSESRQSFQLRFVMNVLRIQHLRRLHTFSRLYALRDRPDIADTIMSQEADHKENAQFIGELKKMLEETTRSMFDELNQVLHQGKSIISGSWNGVLDTISKSTYDVALWKLMAENIDILSTYASEENLSIFLRILFLESPSSARNKSAELDEGSITIDTVSRTLLGRASFYELCNISRCLVPMMLDTFYNLIESAAPKQSGSGIHLAQRALKALRSGGIENAQCDIENLLKITLSKSTLLRGDNLADLLLKIRKLLEIVDSLPPNYIGDVAKQTSCLAVLVLDWFFYNTVLTSHSEETIKQACCSAISSCRRYLATILSTLSSEAVYQALSNSSIIWLYNSGYAQGQRLDTSYTLRLVAIFVRNLARHQLSPQGQDELETLLKFLAGYLTENQNQDKLVITIGMTIEVIKALAEENAALRYPSQTSKIKKNASQSFIKCAEKLLLELLREYPLSSHDIKIYHGYMFSIMEQILAFHNVMQTSSREHESVFSEVGNFASFAFQVLLSTVSLPFSDTQNDLRSRAIHFVEYLCCNMRYFTPQPTKSLFARFFAMLHHLRQLYFNDHKYSSMLQTCYVRLLQNSPTQYIFIVTGALPEELSVTSVTRLIVTLNSILAILKLNDSRILLHFKDIVPTMVHKIVDVINWASALLSPTTDAQLGKNLLNILSTSLIVITHTVGNRMFKIDTHAVSRVLGAVSAFSVAKRRWAVAEQDIRSHFMEMRQQIERNTVITDFLPEELFLALYSFLSRMLKIRFKQIFKCIPLFLLNIREMLSSVFMSQQNLNTSKREKTRRESKEKLPFYQTCTHNLARLLEEMSKHPKQFNKYAHHLLVMYIQLTEIHPLAPNIKQALLPGIYSLLDICGEYEVKVISRLVDETGRAIFRKLFEEYNRDWKFQGKA